MNKLNKPPNRGIKMLGVSGTLRDIPKLFLTLFGLLFSRNLLGLSVVVSGGGVLLPDKTTPLPEGSHASVGYFDEGFADFSGLYGRDWAEVTTADYIEVFRPDVLSSGSLGGSAGINGIEGRQLYLWLFDTPHEPESVGQNAFGLYTGGIDWLAKGDGIIPFEQNRLLVDSVTQAAYGSIVKNGIALAPIPEPNQIAVVTGLVCLVLVVWKRRAGYSEAWAMRFLRSRQ